jgi:dolichol-phosphate mannosyltransferase
VPVLTVVTPFYNEARTLRQSIERVLDIASDDLTLEVILVNDCSRDDSPAIAAALAAEHPEVRVFAHATNQGKGAALRTGIREATGDFVAVHDADLEYDPTDLVRLLGPLREGRADVVFGSRFLTSGPHRVLYFWHSLGNQFLTLLSNMFTDLNLTDMETCYKVFRRDVIQQVTIEEDRFGFEPEVVAKVAAMRLRIYEMGISYYGRTYEEGKKIGVRDGFRALYCIFRYNAHRAPLPVQFLFYLFIGGAAAIANLGMFTAFRAIHLPIVLAAPLAFALAAVLNYLLSVWLLFRTRVRWDTRAELIVYSLVVLAGAAVDLGGTALLTTTGLSEWLSKLGGTALALAVNFLGRRFLVFPEKPSGPWRPQNDPEASTTTYSKPEK